MQNIQCFVTDFLPLCNPLILNELQKAYKTPNKVNKIVQQSY